MIRIRRNSLKLTGNWGTYRRTPATTLRYLLMLKRLMYSTKCWNTSCATCAFRGTTMLKRTADAWWFEALTDQTALTQKLSLLIQTLILRLQLAISAYWGWLSHSMMMRHRWFTFTDALCDSLADTDSLAELENSEASALAWNMMHSMQEWCRVDWVWNRRSH